MTTKKSKSKNVAKKKTAATPKKDERLDVVDVVLAGFLAATTSTIDKRKELLARVAGSVAAGLVAAPSPSIAAASSMAAVAVDIAEEILKKAGIPAVESSAAASSRDDSVEADLGAAS